MILAQEDPTFKVAFSRFALGGKIQHGSDLWPKFNASFDNLDIPLIEIANNIYTGHALTTHHRNHWRHSDNYECGQHMGLDFDTEDDRSRLDTLASETFVRKFAALVYTTPSHTAEKPKARVIFTLDGPIMQAKNYALGATALLWLFGHADRQCKDPCRFFYGSKDCEMEYIGNVLPVAVVQKVIRDYLTSGAVAKRKHSERYQPTADEHDVCEALNCIPAWGIEYDEWVDVLMGIHSAFGENGLRIAESWAEEGYPGEVERKWRSFRDGGNAAGRVTIASVFGIAKRFGWRKITL